MTSHAQRVKEEMDIYERGRKAGAAEALEEAADDFERIAAVQGTFFKAHVLQRLRARAAAIRSEP